MEILKAATEWGKAEVFSSAFFVLFALLFLLACIGFWQFGKTDFSKAFVLPTLVASILLFILGFGLVYSSNARLNNFPSDYEKDASAFVDSEIARAEQTMSTYRNVVFKVFPMIIVLGALLIIFLDKPIWRAIGVTTIVFMALIIWVDSNANARMQDYHQKLTMASEGR